MDEMQTVVFVCEHGSAKSIIAAAHLNRIARQRHLNLKAVGRGTDPDTVIPQYVVDGLRAENLAPDTLKPQRLSLADLQQAVCAVSFCDLPQEYNVVAPIERWTDVPPVSQGYDAARDAIAERVAALVDALSRGRES